LKQHLPRVDVIAFDLPHFRGAGEVLHLMSVISMLDRDLALVYPPLAPVRLLQLLSEHGVRTIEVPDDELDTLGPNVLALAPRVALAVEGNPQTRRRMEQAGVDVTLYAGVELSKGDGGPTCLTRPLLRTP
jgi:N-dimethylarginine dimethylaminohydrolase